MENHPEIAFGHEVGMITNMNLLCIKHELV